MLWGKECLRLMIEILKYKMTSHDEIEMTTHANKQNDIPR